MCLRGRQRSYLSDSLSIQQREVISSQQIHLRHRLSLSLYWHHQDLRYRDLGSGIPGSGIPGSGVQDLESQDLGSQDLGSGISGSGIPGSGIRDPRTWDPWIWDTRLSPQGNSSPKTKKNKKAKQKQLKCCVLQHFSCFVSDFFASWEQKKQKKPKQIR